MMIVLKRLPKRMEKQTVGGGCSRRIRRGESKLYNKWFGGVEQSSRWFGKLGVSVGCESVEVDYFSPSRKQHICYAIEMIMKQKTDGKVV